MTCYADWVPPIHKIKRVHIYHGTTRKVRLNSAWESGTAAEYTRV